MRNRVIRLLAVGSVIAGVALPVLPAGAGPVPTGEVTFGQATIEPAYNDANGQLTYLLTPNKAAFNTNPRAWAPLYLIVYPTNSTVGTLNCMDTPSGTTENCPDHGPLVAALSSIPNLFPGDPVTPEPAVYPSPGAVKGHDHLVAVPGGGGDFNQAWVPEIVLFNANALVGTPGSRPIDQEITTLAQIQAGITAGWLDEPQPVPPAAFHCSVVPWSVYAQGTPV